MSDRNRFITIILIILGIYTLYYYQGALVKFAKSPMDVIWSIGRSGSVSAPQTSGDGVKTVVLNEEDATITVVNQAVPAVVSVVQKQLSFDPFTGPSQSENSIGTGFIVDGKKGVVLTNKHVVDVQDATYTVVTGTGDATYDVDTIYRDPFNDFAILKINTNGQTLPQLELGDSDNLQVGQTVIAIGNALGQFGNSVTKGIVSGLKRGIVAQSGAFGPSETLDNVIQTDAALNPGNSGGPLLNLSGKVVGINVAISQGANSIGFSLPINSLKSVIDEFNTTGKISRPYLGVEYFQVTKDIAASQSIPVGAFVRSVVAGSPAADAGIQAGDIITSINDTRIDDESNTLANVVAGHKVGDTVKVTVYRNGKELAVDAKLADAQQ